MAECLGAILISQFCLQIPIYAQSELENLFIEDCSYRVMNNDHMQGLTYRIKAECSTIQSLAGF